MDDRRYEEIGRNFRFYAAWRHAAFAGGFVIFYAVLALTFVVYIQVPVIAWLIPALGAPAPVLVWLMEARTRGLSRAAINAGKALEGKKGGFFTQLSAILPPKRASWFRRQVESAALDLLLLGSSTCLTLLAVFLYFWTRGWAFLGM